ncbi:hypothetical protein F5Y18DRAFT_218856 [Xylariaceae sp. FL1019]|nr:hypothetical protein F5Y18DRAFT_218856 [Xylariaceae sp. FL1019]
MTLAQTGPSPMYVKADSIADHVAQCLTAFRVLSAATDIDKNLAEGRGAKNASLAKVENQSARFKLWCGNLGAHRTGRSSLDYRLRDSSRLQQQVLKLLQTLEQSVHKAASIVSGEDEDIDALSEDDSDLDSEDMLELRELGSESPLEQAVSTIKTIVDCLLRLSMSIRNPAPSDRFISSKSTDTSHFEPHDISYVRDKFGDADNYLIERLGKAISRRRQYFRYRQSHREKLGVGLDINDGRTEAQSTVASSIPLALKDSTNTQSPVTELDDDAYSNAGFSHTSFATTAPESGRLKIPSLPKQYVDGPFECPLCCMVILVTTTIEWKRHVMADLKPYICIDRDCITSNVEFAQRHVWTEHVLQKHWKSWHCPFSCTKTCASAGELRKHFAESHPAVVSPDEVSMVVDASERKLLPLTEMECPLCKVKLESFKQYQRHVGRHQTELALFALPSIEDQVDIEDYDDTKSDNVSSLSSSENLEIASRNDDDKDAPEKHIVEQPSSIAAELNNLALKFPAATDVLDGLRRLVIQGDIQGSLQPTQLSFGILATHYGGKDNIPLELMNGIKQIAGVHNLEMILRDSLPQQRQMVDEPDRPPSSHHPSIKIENVNHGSEYDRSAKNSLKEEHIARLNEEIANRRPVPAEQLSIDAALKAREREEMLNFIRTITHL